MNKVDLDESAFLFFVLESGIINWPDHLVRFGLVNTNYEKKL